MWQAGAEFSTLTFAHVAVGLDGKSKFPPSLRPPACMAPVRIVDLELVDAGEPTARPTRGLAPPLPAFFWRSLSLSAFPSPQRRPTTPAACSNESARAMFAAVEGGAWRRQSFATAVRRRLAPGPAFFGSLLFN